MMRKTPPRLTGHVRPAVHCKICNKDYLDPCVMHCRIPDSWELKY